MKFSFRKRIKIAPGIHLNVSKSGVSGSIGRQGATINSKGSEFFIFISILILILIFVFSKFHSNVNGNTNRNINVPKKIHTQKSVKKDLYSQEVITTQEDYNTIVNSGARLFKYQERNGGWYLKNLDTNKTWLLQPKKAEEQLK